MERVVVCGEIYRHFKGRLYQIIGVAKHSETMEAMVVYQALYGDYSLYVRPLAMFLSEVDHQKYPKETEIYRFTKVERSSLDATKPEFVPNEETGVKASKEQVTDIERHPEADLVNSDLMAFLDAKDYASKLEVLYSIRKQLSDRLMSDIELSMDLPIGKGTLEERLLIVQENLQTLAKYEYRRLR